MDAVLGRNGSGWGSGLHESEPDSKSVKKEGDGKTPLGIFALGPVFGFSTPEEMAGLKAEYIQVTGGLECVDDKASGHYNQLVLRDSMVQEDWTSSEKMFEYTTAYEIGVIVEHNTDPVKSGAGSCIFLHVWSGPSSSTAGCIAASLSNIIRIVDWLDSDEQPVLVMLTMNAFSDWKLSGKLSELEL